MGFWGVGWVGEGGGGRGVGLTNVHWLQCTHGLICIMFINRLHPGSVLCKEVSQCIIGHCHNTMV